MASPKRGASKGSFVSVTTEQDVSRFKKGAQAFTTQATSSQKKARDTLVKAGIFTKSGQLSKNYK